MADNTLHRLSLRDAVRISKISKTSPTAVYHNKRTFKTKIIEHLGKY